MRLDVLKNFITETIGEEPNRSNDYCYMLILSARKKYLTPEENEKYNIGNRYDCLKRKIIWTRPDKKLVDRLVSAISEISWEFNSSSYEGDTAMVDGVEIPRKALVYYFTMNQRDGQKAAVEYSKQVIDRLVEGRTFGNQETILHSLLHSNPATPKRFLDFDFDIDPSFDKMTLVPEIKDILGNTVYRIIGTHGGLHVLIDTATIDKNAQKTFYKDILDLDDDERVVIEVKNDPMIPLPGTWQGNKIVEVIK